MDRLEALKVFCTVVEQGGFSRAADRLGISTASVTKQVSALEQHFGVRLLHRTTRRMSLTEEGRLCYEQALQLSAAATELDEALRDRGERPAGLLRIDMPGVIARLYVAPALPGFLQRYPDLRLRATVSDRHIDMVEEGIDVLVRIGELASSSLMARQLCATRYLCCAAPDYLQHHGRPATPEDLGHFTCLNYLQPGSRQPRPWRFRRDGEELALVPEAALSMDQPEALLEAARAGCGIVQLMSISVLPALRAGELVPVLEEWAAPGPPVSALFQQRPSRAAKVNAFLEFLIPLFAG